MHCKSCEVLIADALEEIGVVSSVDSVKGIVDVEFDPEEVSLDRIKKVIEDEGEYVVE